MKYAIDPQMYARLIARAVAVKDLDSLCWYRTQAREQIELFQRDGDALNVAFWTAIRLAAVEGMATVAKTREGAGV